MFRQQKLIFIVHSPELGELSAVLSSLGSGVDSPRDDGTSQLPEEEAICIKKRGTFGEAVRKPILSNFMNPLNCLLQ